MTSQLCTRHSKEITALDIIETFKNLKIRNSFHDLKQYYTVTVLFALLIANDWVYNRPVHSHCTT